MTPVETAAISVILPAYNVGAHIGAAIASLREQSFPRFEALVIDDGSTDDTAAQARAAIGADPRFRLIQQPNCGLSGARNTGLDLARAPFIAFLDGDDRFDPAFLETLHGDLSSSAADWVACGLAFCTPDDTRHPHSAIHGRPEPANPPQTTAYPLSDWCDVVCHFPSAWNKLYRRDFIGDLRFDDGTWYEDHTFFHRLAAKSQVLRHIPRPLYLYTLDREGQITRADCDRVFEQFPVLETSAAIFRAADKTGAETGLARLATRLLCERLEVIKLPGRAARFRREAASFFARHHLQPDWQWDRFLNPLTALSLTGSPILLRHPTPDAGPLPDLLPAPDSPFAPLFRCATPDQPLGKDSLVIDLPAQARIDHAALAMAAETLLNGDLAALLLPLIHPGPAAPPRMLTPDDALDLIPEQHAILTWATFAAPPPPGDDAQLTLTAQALRLCQAQAMVAWAPTPIAPSSQFPPPDLSKRLRALDQWHPAEPHLLPPGWKRRLALRAATACITEVCPQGKWHDLKAQRARLHLWWSGLRRGWVGAPGTVDADTPPVLRQIFRLPPME